MKNNVFFEQSSMKTYSSLPQKLNQDLEKVDNMVFLRSWCCKT